MHIKREIYRVVKEHLKRKEITLIVGPRQVGKTTLMRDMKKYLDKQGEPTMFLNMDVARDKEYFSSQDVLVRGIETTLGRGKGFVFLDEIQRKQDAGIFLKGIYDMNLPYKFIVSGSGSLELKEKIHESLAGRKRLFEMQSVSLREYLNHQTGYHYEDGLEKYGLAESAQAARFIEEYLLFGGYPAVVLEDTVSGKIGAMDEILKSYMEKDILNLLHLEKSDEFLSLMRVLADQIGRLVNYAELSSTLRLSTQTVKHYIWYLEKTFILRRISPFFRNARKEITKSPVVYYNDLGLRNYVLGQFKTPTPGEMGFLFQNFVLILLREKLRFTAATVHFWRTTEKAEVDFIVDFGRRIIPVEVKYRNMEKPVVERSMRSFINKYSPEKVLIINRNYSGRYPIGKTEVLFLPILEFLWLKITDLL